MFDAGMYCHSGLHRRTNSQAEWVKRRAGTRVDRAGNQDSDSWRCGRVKRRPRIQIVDRTSELQQSKSHAVGWNRFCDGGGVRPAEALIVGKEIPLSAKHILGN